MATIGLSFAKAFPLKTTASAPAWIKFVVFIEVHSPNIRH
jgi:hypothetical protein